MIPAGFTIDWDRVVSPERSANALIDATTTFQGRRGVVGALPHWPIGLAWQPENMKLACASKLASSNRSVGTIGRKVGKAPSM
jgi:hypothetical protein